MDPPLLWGVYYLKKTPDQGSTVEYCLAKIKTSGSDRSNVVWQYLYNMRLSKLKGLTEDEQVPNEEEAMKKLKFASEKFEQTLRLYKKENLFWRKMTIPEGDVNISLFLDLIPFTPQRYKEKFLGEITLKVDFMPKMEPKPVIPLNILQVTVSEFVDSLLKINPDIKEKPSVYPSDLLNMYHLKFMGIYVYPENGIIYLKDYMDAPTYNLKFLSPNGFGSIMFSRSHLLNVYSLTQGDLPTFADGYRLAIEKLVKKTKSVYNALKEGTWKGHTYKLDPPINWRSGIVIHHDRLDYNRLDKILYPNFKPKLNLGWEFVDGLKNSPEESVLQPLERESFRDWLRKRFENFGIEY